LQFHPEVYHSTEGKLILKNFLVNICGCTQDWTPQHFITDTVAALKKANWQPQSGDGIKWRC